MRRFALLFVCLGLFFSAMAQDQKARSGTLYGTYQTPSDQNGPELVFVKVEYRLTAYMGELVLGMAARCDISGNYRFRGLVTNQWAQLPAYGRVRGKDPVVRVRVTGPGLDREVTMEVVEGGSNGVLGVNSTSVATIGKGNPGAYSVTLLSVDRVSIVNTSELHGELEKMEKEKEQAARVRALVSRSYELIRQQQFDEVAANISVARSNIPASDRTDLKWEVERLDNEYKRARRNFEDDKKRRAEEQKQEEEERRRREEARRAEEAEKKQRSSSGGSKPGLVVDGAGSGSGGSGSTSKEEKAKEKEPERTKEQEDQDAALARLRYRAGFLREQAKELEESYKYDEAIAKYEEAQRTMYDYDTQKRLDDLKKRHASVQAVEALREGLGNAFDKADPEGLTWDQHMGIIYNGLLTPKPTANSKGDYKQPMDVYGIATLSRMFLSLQFRIGYSQSGNVELTTRNKYGNEAGMERVLVNRNGISPGASLGVNLPLRPVYPFFLYGVDVCGTMLGIGKGQLISNTYKLDDSKDAADAFPLLQWRMDAGVNIYIPKTKVGFSFRYTQVTIKKPKNGKALELTRDGSNDTYTLGEFVEKQYKFSNFGIGFIWMVD